MNIFLSWSGERSRLVAQALRNWLQCVFQDAKPWMSDHDIQAGSRWGEVIGAKLKDGHFAVLCLTRENLRAPWLLFEAGAIAKSVETSRVVPFLVGLKFTDVEPPLAQFHGVLAGKEGALKLVESINASRSEPLAASVIASTFEKWWPDLDEKLRLLPKEELPEQQRSERHLIEEVLERVRALGASNAESTVRTLALWLNQGRIGRRMSQDDLAAAAGIPKEVVVGLESGTMLAPDLLWAQLAKILGVPLPPSVPVTGISIPGTIPV